MVLAARRRQSLGHLEAVSGRETTLTVGRVTREDASLRERENGGLDSPTTLAHAGNLDRLLVGRDTALRDLGVGAETTLSEVRDEGGVHATTDTRGVTVGTENRVRGNLSGLRDLRGNLGVCLVEGTERLGGRLDKGLALGSDNAVSHSGSVTRLGLAYE